MSRVGTDVPATPSVGAAESRELEGLNPGARCVWEEAIFTVTGLGLI